jgi:hypothetical protein
MRSINTADFLAMVRRNERNTNARSEFSTCVTKEAHMPAIIIPVLWVGGAAILLGGGWYVIGHMVH